MSKNHYPFEVYFKEYSELRDLDFHQYSEYHLRLMDGGFNILDAWTSARYYVLTTDYLEMAGKGFIERGGEKGWLPTNKTALFEWLDVFFFKPEKADV